MTLRIDPLMHEVLDVFEANGGYATTGFLVDELNSTRPTVGKRLDKLHAAGKIEYVHEPTAFWHLVDDPRKGGNRDD